MNELDLLAAFTHGVVTFGNLLGVVYNLRRRNLKWIVIHSFGVYFHLSATREHLRDLRSPKS